MRTPLRTHARPFRTLCCPEPAGKCVSPPSLAIERPRLLCFDEGKFASTSLGEVHPYSLVHAPHAGCTVPDL